MADEDYVTMSETGPARRTSALHSETPSSAASPGRGMGGSSGATGGGGPRSDDVPLTELARIWLVQLRTHLWATLLTRSRRKLHNVVEVVSPAFVFLVLLYGVLAAPTIPIPAFIHSLTPVYNLYSAEPIKASSDTDLFDQILKTEAGYAGAVSPSRLYLDTVLVPRLLATNSTVATELATTALADFSAANPVVLPSLDSFLSQVFLGAQTLGRQGHKGLQHLDWYPYFLLHFGKLAFAPDTPAVRSLMAHLNVTTTSFASIAIPAPFPSADAAIAALGDSLWAVVEVTHIEPLHGEFDFTIRMNETFVPNSARVVDPFPQGLGSKYSMYLHSGFATLQYEVSEYLTRLAPAANGRSRIANSGLDNVLALCEPYNKYVTGVPGMYPNASSQTDQLVNGQILAQPPVRAVTLKRVANLAVLQPCWYNMVANCSRYLTSNVTSSPDVTDRVGMYLCLNEAMQRPAPAIFTSSCRAALTTLQSGACQSELDACYLTTPEVALLGPNVSSMPPMLFCPNVSQTPTGQCAISPLSQLLFADTTADKPCAAAFMPGGPCAGVTDPAGQVSCVLAKPTHVSLLCLTAATALRKGSCEDDLQNLCPYGGSLAAFPSLCLALAHDVLSQTCLDTGIVDLVNPLLAAEPVVTNVPIGQSLCRLASELNKLFNRGIAVGAFPAPGYDQSQFFKNSGALFGLVAGMAFVFQFTSFVRIVVQERESKQKTWLLSVGTGRGVIVISHLIIGLFSALISSLLAALILAGVMPAVKLRITFGLLFLYAWSLVPLAMLVGRFFNRTTTAATIAPMFLFAASVPAFVVVGGVNGVGYVLSPAITVFAFNIIALFRQSSAPIDSLSPKLEDAQLVLLGQSFAYLALVALFEVLAETVRSGLLANVHAWFSENFNASAKWVRAAVKPNSVGAGGGSQQQPLLSPDESPARRPALPSTRDRQDVDGADEDALAMRDDAGGHDDDEEMKSIKHADGSTRRMRASGEDVSAAAASPGTHRSQRAGRVVRGYRAACPQTAVSFEGVSRTVGRPLRGVTFDAPWRGLTVITGAAGSGKSTIMNILFDVTTFQAGNVFALGAPLSTLQRGDVVTCLQKDVLWDALTVRDHVEAAQAYKGDTAYARDEDRDAMVDGVIHDLGLNDVRHLRASKLPRGKRRLLAVAMAFVSKRPKLVLLDSPTDGVDPDGVRRIFSLATRRKLEGQSVVITTSNFAEAEYADHVVFIDRGSVAASGSPSSVRGAPVYTIDFVMCRPFPPDDPDDAADSGFSLNEDGGDAAPVLPADRNDVNPGSFLHLQRQVQRLLPSAITEYRLRDEARFAIAADGDDGGQVADAMRRVPDIVPGVAAVTVATAGLEEVLAARLRVEAEEKAKRYVDLLRRFAVDATAESGAGVRDNVDAALRDTLGELGEAMLAQGGLDEARGGGPRSLPTSAHTSQRQLMADADDEEATPDKQQQQKKKKRSARQRRADLMEERLAEEGDDGRHAQRINEYAVAADGTGFVGTQEERDGRQRFIKLHLRMAMTVVTQRWADAMHRDGSLTVHFLIPLIAVAAALLIMAIPFPAPDPLLLTAGSLFEDQDVPVTIARTPAFNASDPSANFDSYGPMVGASHIERTTPVRFRDVSATVNNSASMSRWLNPRRYSHGTNRYGALVWMDAHGYFVNDSSLPERTPTAATSAATASAPVQFTWIADTVLHNTSSPHALPSMASLLHDLRLLADGRGTAIERFGAIRPSTHPIPAGVNVITAERIARNLLSIMLLLVPFSFFPAASINHVVADRQSGLLGTLLASCLTQYHYWFGTFAWNMVNFAGFALAALFIFVFFGHTDIFAGTGSGVTTLYFLMILYAACALSICYCMSYLFKKASTAQNAVMMASLITGFVFVASWAALDLMPSNDATADAKESNKRFGGFLRLFPSFALGQGFVKLSLAPIMRALGEDTSAGAQVAPSMSLMGLFPLYLALVFIAEYVRRTRKWSPTIPPESAATSPPKPVDPDALLHSEGLTVRYTTNGDPSHLDAIKDVSVSVPRGAITCIVGPSGSGKSTLLGCLTGVIKPTTGEAASAALVEAVAGSGDANVFRSYSAFSKSTGVSFDRGTSLDDTPVTPYLLLQIMADLRGLRVTEDTNLHVLKVLRDFGLYAVRYSHTHELSSATRCRIAVAMACLGYPKLILLDAPTSGADPAHRRLIWEALKALPRGTTVVVATQDPAEAARHASYVIELHRGLMVSAGPVRDWQLTAAHAGPRIRVVLENVGEHTDRQRQRADAAAVLSPLVADGDSSTAAVVPTDFQLDGNPHSSRISRPLVSTGHGPEAVRALHELRTHQHPGADVFFHVTDVVPQSAQDSAVV